MIAYVCRVLISIDMLGNVVCGGRIDETISSAVQRMSDSHHNWRRIWRTPVVLFDKLLVGVLNIIQKHHGVNAEQDDLARALEIVSTKG